MAASTPAVTPAASRASGSRSNREGDPGAVLEHRDRRGALYLRGIPRWRRFGTWLLLGSPLTLLLVVLFFATFDPSAAGAQQGVGGLTQRLLVLEVFAWLVAMGWLAFRRPAAAIGRRR